MLLIAAAAWANGLTTHVTTCNDAVALLPEGDMRDFLDAAYGDYDQWVAHCMTSAKEHHWDNYERSRWYAAGPETVAIRRGFRHDGSTE